MKDLTQRQREVLSFISQYTEENICPPTVREIGDHFGISLRAVQDHIAALEKKGFITITKKRSRSIRLVNSKDKKILSAPTQENQVPLLKAEDLIPGELFSTSNLEGYQEIPSKFLSPSAKPFAFIQKDTSMARAGILKDDILIFHQADFSLPSEKIEDGTIILAVTNGKVLVRRYFKEPSRIRLQPEDDAFHPIYVQEIKVFGILKGLVRFWPEENQ